MGIQAGRTLRLLWQKLENIHDAGCMYGTEKGMNMRRMAYRRRSISDNRLWYAEKGIAVALVAFYVTISMDRPLAQPNDTTCGSYGARCQGHTNSPLCTQLPPRCTGSAGGRASLQSPIGSRR